MKILVFSPQRVFVFVTLCWLAGVSWSCKKDDVSARVTGDAIFTLQVNKIIDKPDIFYQTPGKNKYYVVVGDASGKVINYKELTPQTTFTFDKPEGFTDTELTISYVSYSPKHGFFVQSYRNIPVGQSWVATHLDEGTTPPQSQLHQAKVRVSNIPANVKGLFSLSSNAVFANLQTNTDYDLQLAQPTGNNLWFRLEYNNQPPRFLSLSTVAANQTYTLDLSKFEAGVAKRIALSKPTPLYWMFVAGTPAPDFHTLFSMDNNTASQTPLIDKVDFYVPNATFSSHTIQAAVYQTFNNTTNEQSQIMGVFETLPAKLPLIEADFQVTQNTNAGFGMTTNGTFDIYTATSTIDAQPASNSINWGIYGKAQPAVSFTYPALPAAIVSVPTGKLKIQTVTLADYSLANSYDDYLNKGIDGKQGYYTSRSKLVQ
jgi:hypothetical protein